ncbi:MAG: DUF6268 family outer membrane beta-barrel protein [Planctomycetaceae bacterium]|nr:DUF6268 family outer membrane beta-barrel protein [Planctomycetaceae bacterium]
MKHFSITVLIVLLCALPDALIAQGWASSTYEAEPSGQTTYHAPPGDNPSWMTLNRGATNYPAEPQDPSGHRGHYNDPFLSQTGNQQSANPSFVGEPTFEQGYQPMYDPELQDTGYSTLDLLPELPPELPSPAGQPPRGSTLSVAFDARWEPKDSGFGVTEVWGGFKTAAGPPLFGGSPPMVSFSFGMTDLEGIGLGEFYNIAIGINWVKPVNQRWTWMFGFTPGIATDFENTSSDMWQFRGNALAIYAVSPMQQWIFGAVATGRSDIPILPAVGLIWWPHERFKVDLTFPRPRVTWPIASNGDREHWMYVGGELGGGSWAVGLPGGLDDELTYRAYRLAVGVELLPAGARRPGGQPVTSDVAYLEAGISLNREVEFGISTFEPESVFYLGGGVRF